MHGRGESGHLLENSGSVAACGKNEDRLIIKYSGAVFTPIPEYAFGSVFSHLLTFVRYSNALLELFQIKIRLSQQNHRSVTHFETA